MIELKPFIDALGRKDVKEARGWFEGVSGGFDPKDEFLAGYRLALQGMLLALEAGSETSAIWKVVNGRCSREEIGELLRMMRERASHPLRPRDEVGYNRAWVDFLSAWLKR